MTEFCGAYTLMENINMRDFAMLAFPRKSLVALASPNNNEQSTFQTYCRKLLSTRE